MNFDLTSLSQKLNSTAATAESYPEKKRAAVLVPLLNIESHWHLLFIRRADIAGDIHSGQVAFPGGRLNSDESEIEAALREAEEEIGLSEKDVSVLGLLDLFISASDYVVRPVVGLVPWPYRYELEAREVSRVFTMPLKWLADENNYVVKPAGNSRNQYFYNEYNNETLWGMTAAVCHALLERIHN